MEGRRAGSVTEWRVYRTFVTYRVENVAIVVHHIKSATCLLGIGHLFEINHRVYRNQSREYLRFHSVMCATN